MRRWDDILRKIERALDQRDLSLADRLLYESIQIASEEGLVGDLRLPYKNDPDGFFEPDHTIEIVGDVAILMEDSGHEKQAVSLLSLLMQFTDAAFEKRDKTAPYQAMKKSLMLQIQGGAYDSARVVIERILELGPECIGIIEYGTMCHNYGSMLAKGIDLQNAVKSYQDVLLVFETIQRKSSGRKDIGRLIEATQKNLEACGTGYDPDYIFLKANGSPGSTSPHTAG